jgi:tryptophan-rich sensory protein
MKKGKAWISLILIASVTLGVGLLGGRITEPNILPWYRSLVRPGFAPPDWVFGPVWILLYLLMALAAWQVWMRRSTHEVGPALIWYGLQLILNLAWSFLFFGLHRPDLAFLEILILWLAIGITLLTFGKVRKLSGYLLLPYWLWVSFAAVLNFAFWRLNPKI